MTNALRIRNRTPYLWVAASLAAPVLLTIGAASWAAERESSAPLALVALAIVLFWARRWSGKPTSTVRAFTTGLQYLAVTVVAVAVATRTAMPARIELAQFMGQSAADPVYTAFVLASAVAGYGIVLIVRALRIYYQHFYVDTDPAAEPPHDQALSYGLPALAGLLALIFVPGWPSAVLAQMYLISAFSAALIGAFLLAKAFIHRARTRKVAAQNND